MKTFLIVMLFLSTILNVTFIDLYSKSEAENEYFRFNLTTCNYQFKMCRVMLKGGE